MSDKFIKSIIILQNNFLIKKSIINKYNLEYIDLQNIIIKIIDNIELNFSMNLIDLDFYNKNFELIDNYLVKLNELPEKLSIRKFQFRLSDKVIYIKR